MDRSAPLDPDSHVAIVGLACDLPLARSAEGFWLALQAGRSAIETFDEASLLAAGAVPSELAQPDWVRTGVRLHGHDEFDATFFGLSPREAAVMDPQHRRFLQCAWAALEHAGYRPDALDRQTGVFAGAGMGWYLLRNLMGHRALIEDMGEFLVRHLSNDKDFLSTRVSYQLDLRGPSLNVQTACSTSLVAVHLACQSLLSGECDMALAGGVTHESPQGQGYRYREEEVRSPDGHCRAFDAASGGTVFGSGAGIVVLRRLGDALRDGDTIHAVIRGTAINNDGAGKAGYLAPSVDGQAEAAAQAIAVAGIEADSIGYVEAHGTGTRLGDPIEIAALSQAFEGAAPGACAIGSVKTNIGHLDTAAGVAGLIKTTLALAHGEVPASLDFETPNPEIDFAKSPFFVASRRQPWPKSKGPRRAAVNSLGVGGTNAFAVLEQAPAAGEAPLDPADLPHAVPQSLLLSAKTPEALLARARDLADHLRGTPQPLGDVAWTLREGRVPMACRTSVAASTRAEAVATLEAWVAAPAVSTALSTPPALIFAFPGQGAQTVGMVRAIAAHDADVHAALEACITELSSLGAHEAVELLRDAAPGPENQARLRRTENAQPVLFAAEYALARGLQARGLLPQAMLGHSLGEYVAATLAGVFELPAALRLMQVRGALCAQPAKGAMLAVQASESALHVVMPAGLDFAAMNAPEQTVVAGPEAAVADFETRLGELGIGTRRLETSAAFHSSLLDAVLPAFREAVLAARSRQVAALRVISTCTGQWLTPEQAASADYWVRHLREPVRFLDALSCMASIGDTLMLEVGPGSTLSKLAKQREADARTLPVLPDPQQEAKHWSGLPGRLWALGVDPDWARWRQVTSGRRVALPTYPFAATRHWIAPAMTDTSDLASASAALGRDDWLQVPVWQPAPLPSRIDPPSVATASPRSALVLCDSQGIGDALAQRLRDSGWAVRTARHGDGFVQDGEAVTLDPRQPAHWQALAATPAPSLLVDLWAVDAAPEDVAEEQRVCFDDALRMVQGLAPWAEAAEPLHWLSVSVSALAVGDATNLRPGQALRAGPVRTWPQEATNLTATWFDVDEAALRAPSRVAAVLHAEIDAGFHDDTVALRGRQRWRPQWRALGLPCDAQPASFAGLEGEVLLTGAFGGVGRALVEHLAKRGGSTRLWLVSRADVESDAVRSAWLDALRRFGADIRVLVADVAVPGALEAAVARAGITRLDTLLHAAGSLDDQLIALKTVESAHAVIAPKWQGAREVAAVARQTAAAHVLYFSSVSAQMGASGQVDYTAANACMDAFAAREDARSASTRHVAVAFSIWRDAGMAARLAAGMGLAPPPFEGGVPQAHPLLHYRRDEGATVVFGGVVGADSDWVLDGHRLLGGDALLPGTGLLDLLSWALNTLHGGFRPFHCEGLTIAAPLVFAGGERRAVSLRLQPEGDSACRVTWSSLGAGDDEATEHASLRAVFAPTPVPVPLQLDAPRDLHPATYTHPGLRFGPEWQCLTHLEASADEALLHLEVAHGLDAAHPLHPALLDMAFGAGQAVLAGAALDVGRLLPYRYGRIDVLAPLPPRVHSRQRARRESDALILDIDVVDEAGTPLVLVRDFVLKTARRMAGAPPVRRSPPPGQSLLAIGFRDGFSTAEGLAAIATVLGSECPPQIALSRRSLDALVADTRRAAKGGATVDESAASSATPVLRTPGSRPFAPPTTPLQQRLVGLWERLLDLGGVGIDDDFFALGGHSLLLTRVLYRLKREDGIALSIDAAFEAPTIRDWCALADAAESTGAPALPPLQRIERRPSADGRLRFPTTHSQRQLFYVQAMAPENTAYNIPFAFTLRGALDVEALTGAIDDVVAMHEALRTHFELVDGEVLQVVDPGARSGLETIDLSGMPSDAVADALREIRQAVARHAFSLSDGPPHLFLLVKASAEEHVLLFCLHHVLVDHIGVLHIGHGLEARYAARRAGRCEPAVGPALQLPDFALWQAETMDAAAIASRLPHWLESLAPCPPVLDLRTDRPRPAQQDFQGAEHRVAFSAAVSARLRAFAQHQQQTPFVVLLAALAVLLCDETGQERVVVGCPFANRQAEELEPVVGLFMNLLPLGFHVPPQASFETLLAQVRRQVARTQAVQDTPFPEILKALGLRRDPSRNPLVQIWYTFQEAPMSLSFDGLQVVSEALPNGGAKLDLSFWFWDDGERIQALVEYATALFDEATVAGLAQRLEATLDRLMASTAAHEPLHTSESVDSPRGENPSVEETG